MHASIRLAALFSTLALLAVSNPPQAHAQIAAWAAPNSGFFDTPGNWNPATVPTSNDTLVFSQTGSYDIGLTGAHGAANLSVSNDAEIDFVVAGADPATRLLFLSGDLSIDEARLRLLGNTSGPRLNVVLDGDIDIFGRSLALQLVDNVALLNRSAVIDTTGEIPVNGALARWSMSGNLRLRGGSQLTISEGGTVASQNDVFLGGTSASDLSNGSALVTGVGDDGLPSTLEVEEGLFVGRYGVSDLTISDGGYVNAKGRLFAATGAGSVANIRVIGVDNTGNPSVLDTDLLFLGDGGLANLDIRSGGVVNSTDAVVASTGRAFVELTAGNHPAEWNIAGSLRISEDARGEVLVENGAILRSGEALLGLGNSTNDSAAIILTGDQTTATSLWENQGDAYLGGNELGARSPGLLRINGNAEAKIGGGLTIWNQGTLRLGDGGALTADTIDHTNGGVFDFEGGALSVNRFEGNLTNLGGSLAPGADGGAGATLVTGDYNQQSDATLAIGVGGRAPAARTIW